MKNPHILLVTISDDDLDPDPVETKLNGAKDWLRYAPGCWLVLTKQSAGVWDSRLRDVIDEKRSLLFICEANLDERAGRLSPSAWSWIAKARRQSALIAS